MKNTAVFLFCMGALLFIFGSCASATQEIEAVQSVPGFETGLNTNPAVVASESWSLFVGPFDGAAEAHLENDNVRIEIIQPGAPEYAVQLIYTPVLVEAGGEYRVRFTAHASRPRSIDVKVGGNETRSWADYTGGVRKRLTSEPVEYEFTFMMQERTDKEARFEFQLGQYPGDVVLSNVSMVKIGQEDIDPASFQAAAFHEIAEYEVDYDSMQLVWSDEFDYEGLPDPSRWGYEAGGHGWGNNELQHYTRDRLENARVEDGRLIITARKEDYQRSAYTSARLVTRGKGDWLYGRVEVKARLPRGLGTWPAIWMMPTRSSYGNWPDSGEIDIMEHVGFNHNRIHGAVHTASYNHRIGTQKSGTIIPTTDVSDEFHLYAIEWDPNEIRWFLDNKHYFTFRNEGTGHREWPFDREFYLILNIAIGGDWGGMQGIDDSIWPQTMEVEYVRVYDLGDAALDTEPPTAPGELSVAPSSITAFLEWEPSIDNVGVKEYSVYVNGELSTTTDQHETLIRGLQPEQAYTVRISAVDYAGNISEYSETSFSTSQLDPVSIPGRIQAAAYLDMQGIQTQETEDTGGGMNVGWIDSGDWLEYMVNTSGNQDFTAAFRIASPEGIGRIELRDENDTVLTSLSLPQTGGWQDWETIVSSPFSLPAGSQVIRVYAAEGGFNLNWLELD
ncbi:family 16 glycosylhydrolase [Spirochaeta dissipatitropha]